MYSGEVARSERLLVELTGRPEGPFEILRILWPSQAEVREVVKELVEDLLAVLGVGLGVQDVVVPHRVHIRRWHDVDLGNRCVEQQESLVADTDVVDLVAVPPHALFLVHQLHLDHREVELLDGLFRAVAGDMPEVDAGLACLPLAGAAAALALTRLHLFDHLGPRFSFP